MGNDSGELGQGTIWSIASANALVEKPMDTALAACATHVDFATDIYLEQQYNDGVQTQLRTIERFGHVAHTIIQDWTESGGIRLAVPHEAFANRRARNLGGDGEHAIPVVDFDPEVKHLSTAAHRMRVVRLAVPEILRAHRPSVEEAEAAGLSEVAQKLEITSVRHKRITPVSRSYDREPSSYRRPTRRWRY